MESNYKSIRSLNLFISFDADIKTLFPFLKKKVVWYENQVLDSILKDFLKQNKISLNKKYFLYLKRNNKIIEKLTKQKKLLDLKLEKNDEILVSYDEFKIFPNLNEGKQKNARKINNEKIEEKITTETIEELIKIQKSRIKLNMIDDDTNSKKQSSNIITTKNENNNRENNSKYNFINRLKNIIKNKIFMIITGLVIGILLIGVVIFLIIKYKRKKLIDNLLEYKNEELIIKKRYPLNLLLRYDSLKETEIQIEGGNDSKLNISETYDFIFIARQKMIEKEEKNHIEKELFIGYIGVLNHTIINETDNIVTVYDKKLNEYLNQKKIDENSQHLKYVENNRSLCFAKIEFYLNGEIKNFYLPKEFSEEYFVFIEDISQLIIPKISSKLFSKNISKKMEEILSKDNESTNRRLSNRNNKKYKIPSNSKNFKEGTNEKKRKLEDLDYTEADYTDDLLIEEYLVEPISESKNIDLREANEKNVSSDNNITKSIFQLTQYSYKNIENENAKMEGSINYITIFSTIDEEGLLESVEKTSFSSMSHPDNINNEKYEKTENLDSQIYDINNQISSNDMKSSLNEKEFNNNNNFNLSSITIKNTMIINRTDYFQNESLIIKLYKYFDDCIYNLHNIIKNESINELFKEDEKEKRDLQEEESYYGLKKISSVKDLYNYDLIGLKLEKQIFNEINPKTGTISTYFVMIFGNKNIKIKVADQQTNLHIILEKKNKMAYNLLLLLNQSNIDLTERNKKYLDIIINIENNITNFLKNYDYTEIFKDSLENLSLKIGNFSGEIFYELFNLVDKVYENYTYILNSIINDDYDFINQIIEITRDEYIKYIYNMIDIIERFENETMNFLKGLEQETKSLDNFQIDILYDIIEVIHEANLIFKKFNEYLFKSIEKGILTFKYDIKNFVEEIIGDILYVVDFLSININKNEIIKKIFDYETRNNTSKKLQSIKDVIKSVIEKIINNINKDYEFQMRLDNKNGIKNYSLLKEKEILFNTEKKSNQVSKDIKSKIKNIELYELYSENLNEINNIINKTITEYIHHIHNNILFESINLNPQYFDEESILMKNRQILFILSKNITKQANLEINDLYQFIYNNTNKFKDENIYNIYYNLYQLKKIFSNEQMSNLLNEFIILFKNFAYKKINQIEKIIDNNFNLINDILKEQNKFFEREFFGSNIIYVPISFCTGFRDRYNKYKEKFSEILDAVKNDDFSNLFVTYFYQLKNEIINFVKSKLNSINQYYFNINLLNNNFKFIEDIKEENIKIVENIENYFNANNFKIKLEELLNLFKEIFPYYFDKINELDNFYYSILRKTSSPGIIDCSQDIAVETKICMKDLPSICLQFKSEWIKYEIKNKKNITNLIQTKIDYSENYLIREINEIKANFINKFEKYLYNNFQYIQNFYSNLKDIVEKKIKDSQINELLIKYKSYFDDIISKNYCEEILHKFNKVNFEERLNNSLYELEKNINLLNESYYQSYFLPNFANFIEYPEEIIFKINQFQKELIYNSGNIIKGMNYLFKNRMKNIINSTNIFITNFLNQDLKYILININSTYAIERYWLNIYNEINKVFGECFIFNNDKSMKNSCYDSENIDLLLYINNYNNSIKNIINKSSNFIDYLENLINETFIIEISEHEEVNYKYNYSSDNKEFINGTNELLDNFTNNILEVNLTSNYTKEKKQIDSNYSKYNYNIAKIRTGIYYTKSLFENLEEIFGELNMQNIININKINYYDNLLNNKNILDFYNETNYKYIQVIKNSELFNIEESIQNLVIYLKKNIYLFENDYQLLLQQFKEIIKFENKDFENNITYKNEEIINKIFLLLNQFNKTLFNQISLRDNYQLYNINETYFKEIYLYYYSLINEAFIEYKKQINSFNQDYNFHNIIKKKFNKHISIKKEYYKFIINNYSTIFNFDLFGKNYDIGEYQSDSIQSEINEYEFTKKYDYIEIFETNEDKYKKKIMNFINILESRIKEKYDKIYNYFFSNYKNNISSYINISYIQKLEENYVFCQKFSKDENYKIYIEHINIIYDNCSKNNEINSNSKEYSLNEKITYIKDKRCFDVINNEFYKDINNFINCYINNFFNYTAFYFNNFSNIYKEDLSNNINEIIQEIKDNYIDDNYLYEFLEKINELDEYKEINFNELENFLQDIEDMILYSKNSYYDDLINHISNSLIYYFNSSYSNLFNNFIINELTDNITIIINNKFQTKIDYILNKIENEFNYYLLILNNTDEIGESSKNKLINLYENINKKINETLFSLVQDKIYFYLDLFYKENKNNFINNFINYYLNESNHYNINYFNFIKEIFADKEFNKAIEKISKDLIYNLILSKLKILINDSIFNKVNILSNKVDILKIKIQNNLNYIKTQEITKNMIIINNLILNYTDIVNNQNNNFLFKISGDPFDLLFEFINNTLKPPLLLIKNEYNNIEENFLNEIFEIIEKFPDYYSIIKNEFNFESKINNITSYFEIINTIFMEYIDILNKDLESYINKLIHYTFIDGLNSLDKPCNEPFCKIDLEDKNNYTELNNKEARRLNLDNNNIFYNSIINETKNLRNLNEYNSKMGAISEEDINEYISKIKNTLFNFYNSYGTKGCSNMKKNLNLFLMKSCNSYLLKLKNNIDLVSLKFLTILTREANNKLKIKLYNQYNEIEYYIKNNSKNIAVVVEKYLNLLNNSFNLMELSYSIVYERGNEYFQIFSDIIQGKLKSISDEEMKSYRYRNLFEISALQNSMEYISTYFKNNIMAFRIDLNEFKNRWKNNLNNFKNQFKYEETTKTQINLDLIEKTFSASISFCKGITSKLEFLFKKFKFMKIAILIIPGINLEFAIKPFFNARVCFGIGFYKNLTVSNDSYFFITRYGEAEIGVDLDAGIYIPTSISNIHFGVSLGLKGILGSGKIGIKLQMLSKGEPKYLFSFDLFSELHALSLSFYVKMTFEISFINHSTEFEIYKKQIIEYKKEFHEIRYFILKDSKLEVLCQEIAIEGWTSDFMSKEDKDKMKKISPCKKHYY